MASGIVLSAATRSSLLSAQDTAQLLQTTQNRLSTGKKVNSALDNPTNFFTASGLDSRASDLTNLLDSISNGIQTINAASQGVTNIQKLVDSAKSTANQALSTTLNTTGTATTAYAGATAAGTVNFKIDGVAKSAAIASTDTIDMAIANLNTGAGANVFTKDVTGTKIMVNGQGKIEIGASADQTKLGFTNVTTDNSATAYYNETNNAQELTINGLSTRYDLSQQYNQLLSQIDQLAKDASYNGTNLITSKATTNKVHIQFNENDTSNIDVQGVDATSTGIGLSTISATPTASFSVNSDITAVISKLNTATTSLRGYSSQLGSSLTVVQNRQDFTKQLVNVLQTGSGKLVNADLNEEAANSQALSTRQSLAISALSLANQAQQGVLQLLR